MTWENGRSLPVLCLQVLSQNRMTRHEICNVPVERNGREKKGREEGGEKEVGKEGKEDMEGREGKREGVGRRKDKMKRGKMHM